MAEYTERSLSDGSVELGVEGSSKDGRVRTLRDLLDKFEVDETKYIVSSWKPNSWETVFRTNGEVERITNYSVKAHLQLNKDFVTASENAKTFLELVKNHSPKYTKLIRRHIRGHEGIIAVMDLFDLHMGMLAWGQETGNDDWDSSIGEQIALEAIEDLTDRLQGMNITKIIFPMGNDLLHADVTIQGKGGATANNTPQDVDTRYLKMFRTALHLVIQIIDRLRQIAPVEVIVIPGNHDRERVAYMGEAIYAWYRNDPEVTVDNNANLRKYVVAGNTLLGFTHGDGERAEDLPAIMAGEKKKEWAETEYRVFHTGHLHRKRRMLAVTTDTYNGVEVLTLPSLVPPDSWHAMKGYVGGGRAAEAHLYGEYSGPCGYFRYSLPTKSG